MWRSPRGVLGIGLAGLVTVALAPAAVADNVAVVGDGLNAEGALDLGDVCRGTSASGDLRFSLERRGDPNTNTWASSSLVNITGSATASSSGTVSLGSASVSTPSDWATVGSKGDNLDAGTAPVSVTVHSDAPLGPAASVTTWQATGARFGSGTLTRTDGVSVTWRVVSCAPVDTTPPTLGFTLDPGQPDGANGWYRQDVAIDWTVSDAESAAVATGCADQTFSADGTHTSTCSATSGGGTAGPTSATIRRDATAPSVAPVVTGEQGSNGWYVGDVSVSWTVADDTSGLDPATTCEPSTLTEDVVQRTFTCTVRDRAGNQTQESITLKRDSSDPLISSSVSGALGQLGWYVGDVAVTWSVTDATSQVASTVGCADVTLTADTAGTTYTCTATDHAGNESSDSVSVRRDATAPDITFARAGTRGSNDWFTSAVGLTWDVSDAGAGVSSSQGCAAQVVTVDGRHRITCSATDAAGNTASSTAQVDKDATAPLVVGTVTGETGLAGWYTGDAEVVWEVSDLVSGVSQGVGCEPALVDADTTGADFTCSGTDMAGNTASETLTVKRDATVPAVSFAPGSPADGASYWFGDPVPTASCSATDVTSGVGGCAVTGASTSVGSHTLTASATDHAGNTGTATRSYTVRSWRLEGFYRPVVLGAGVVNTVKAGSTVPLKFNVFRDTVPMTSGIGAVFSARKVACDTGDLQDPLEEFATTGGTELRYDVAGGQWVQNWATPGSGRGSCYRVSLTTADGSITSADFRLK